MRGSLINLNFIAADAVGQCLIHQVRFHRRRGDEVKVFTLHPAEGIPADVADAALLRGVNDRPDELVALSETLFEAGVLPYYLHLLDPVAGAAHFDVTAGHHVDSTVARIWSFLFPQRA